MFKKLPKWIIALMAVLLIAGAVGATAVYAQGGTPQAPTGQPGDGPGSHGGRGLPQAELEAAAKALGMTSDELSTALKDGKTLEELATSAGVDLQTVQDAMKAARDTEMRTRIQEAVTDGTMTQDKANWLLEGLDKGYLDGPGFGFGFGPHGPGGPGGHSTDQQPAAQGTTQQPAATATP